MLVVAEHFLSVLAWQRPRLSLSTPLEVLSLGTAFAQMKMGVSAFIRGITPPSLYTCRVEGLSSDGPRNARSDPLSRRAMLGEKAAERAWSTQGPQPPYRLGAIRP